MTPRRGAAVPPDGRSAVGTFAIPRTVGPSGLAVVEELGRGAGTLLYRVRREGEDYALKILSALPPDPEGTLLVFRREAALLAGVDDPGLPRIHEVGEYEGRPYLVMDLLEGRDLAAVLQEGPLDEPAALRLATELAGTLDAVHGMGLVHRDLTPVNIMLLDCGRACLVDFDLATWHVGRWPEEAGDAVALRYAAPERSGVLKRPVDNRSDLYSLGVVLYECLTGRPPFVTVDTAELLRMQAVVDPPDVRSSAPGVSAGLARVIARLLAKDPDDRYQSGRELAAGLRRLRIGGDTDTCPDADADAGAADRADAVYGRGPDPDGTFRQDGPPCAGHDGSDGDGDGSDGHGDGDRVLRGRDAELRRLTGRWAQAAAGHGGVCLLRGAVGIGKSRLASEFAGRVSAQGGLVLSAACSSGDPTPLAALRSAVDGHLSAVQTLPAGRREQAEHWLDAASGQAAPLLAALSPALAAAQASGGELDEDRQKQSITAIVGFLAELATVPGGLLLLLDDVQWLDPRSREVLAELAAELPRLPILILATANDHESTGHDGRAAGAAGTGPVARDATGGGGVPGDLDDSGDPGDPGEADGAALIAFATSLGAALDLEISLRPLGESAVADLVARQLPGIDAGSRLGRLLTARTNGNPLLVQEYVRAIVEAGLLWPSWGRWLVDESGLDALALPNDALGVILARIGRIDSAGRCHLRAAAAIGGRFSATTVAAVCGDERSDVLATMNEAVARRLIEPRGRDGFAFLHDRIGSALLEGLDGAAMAALHLRIAEALESTPATGPARVYRIAHHYMLGGATGTTGTTGATGATGATGGRGRNRAREFRACYSAGRLALQEHAVTEAVRFLEHAAGCGIPLDGRFRRYLGTALNRDGRFSEAQAELEAALEAESSPLRRAAIFAELAHGYRTVWRTAECCDAVHRGLSELNAAFPEKQAMRFATSFVIFVAGMIINATRLGFGTAKGWRRERHKVLSSLHEIGGYLGVITMRPQTLLLHTMRGFYAATRLGTGRQYAMSRGAIGILMCLRGARRRGRLHLRHAAGIADRLGDQRLAARIAWYGASASFLLGEDDGESWRKVLDEYGRWLDTGFYVDAAASMVWENVMSGRSAEARAWADRALRRLRSGVGATSTSMMTAGAVLDTMSGRFAGAGVELGRVAMLLDGRQAWSLKANLMLADMYACVERQDYGRAFEDAVARSVELGLTPRRSLRQHRHFFGLQAFGRLAQCRQAEGPLPAAALLEADSAVRLLAAAACSPLTRAYAAVAAADLLILQDRPAKALSRLSRLRPPRPDSPLVAFEVAVTRARALRALGYREESLRQARLARLVAAEQEWAHRARWVSAEFGLATTTHCVEAGRPWDPWRGNRFPSPTDARPS